MELTNTPEKANTIPIGDVPLEVVSAFEDVSKYDLVELNARIRQGCVLQDNVEDHGESQRKDLCEVGSFRLEHIDLRPRDDVEQSCGNGEMETRECDLSIA